MRAFNSLLPTMRRHSLLSHSRTLAVLAPVLLGSCSVLEFFESEPTPIAAVELPVELPSPPLPPAAESLPEPAPRIRLVHDFGTPLSGPRVLATANAEAGADQVASAPEPLAAVRWTLIAGRMPLVPAADPDEPDTASDAPQPENPIAPEPLGPLAAAATLLVDPGAKSPLRVRTRLAREAELNKLSAADASKVLAAEGNLLLTRRTALLLPDQTARLSIERTPGGDLVGLDLWSSMSKQVELTVAIQGEDALSVDAGSGLLADEDEAAPNLGTSRLEFLPLAEPLPAAGEGLWLVFPGFFRATESEQGEPLPERDLLAFVEQLPETLSAEDPRAIEARSLAERGVRREGTAGSIDPLAAPIQRLEDLSRQNAIEALRRDDTRRSALIRLADTHTAPLCADLALVASDGLIAALAEDVAPRMGQSKGQLDLTWLLERSAVLTASAALQKAELGDAAAAALLRHAGEAGHFASTLLDAARGSKNLESFRARLVEENRLFLTDRNPAARSRALRYLQGLGLAPANYEPLATRDERRAALQADRELREAQGSQKQ